MKEGVEANMEQIEPGRRKTKGHIGVPRATSMHIQNKKKKQPATSNEIMVKIASWVEPHSLIWSVRCRFYCCPMWCCSKYANRGKELRSWTCDRVSAGTTNAPNVTRWHAGAGKQPTAGRHPGDVTRQRQPASACIVTVPVGLSAPAGCGGGIPAGGTAGWATRQSPPH